MSEVYKKRFEVVFLVCHPKGPKMSVVQAARYTKRSESFVRKWVQRYQSTGKVDDDERSGRPTATTLKETDVIVKFFEADANMTVVKAKELLAKKGIEVSTSTIRRRIKEKGIELRSTVLKPLLTPAHVEKRLAWATENEDRDWTNIIFTDESSFWIYNPFKRVWAKTGDTVIQGSVKHPQKIHVWGCFSSKGFGRLICFTHILNAERMLKLYKKGLLPSATKFFGDGNKNWVLQEDNDPKHRSRLCQEWKRQNAIETLDWPSQSPDANPIENVWALMKYKLRGKKIKSLQHFRKTIQKIWKTFDDEYAINLVESCPRRCRAIIDNQGDWTKY